MNIQTKKESMKYFKTILLSVVAAFSFTGCSDDDNGSSSPAGAAGNFVQEPDLNGRYSNDCSGSELANLSMRTTYRFNADGSFSQYQDFYESEDCSDNESLGVVELGGSYTVDSDGAPESEGGAIQFEIKQAKITVQSALLADAMNAISFCGQDSYEEGSETEITETSDNALCPVKSVPDTLYGVYREDDGSFYLNEGGMSEMGESEEDRPNDLDQENVYRKQ